jgi:hypothetical protein
MALANKMPWDVFGLWQEKNVPRSFHQSYIHVVTT